LEEVIIINQEKTLSKVKAEQELTWTKFSEHQDVSYCQLVNTNDADWLRIEVSSVLRERIEVGGAVLPHYHDVAEIIHFTKGNVKILFNETWLSCSAGDTFLVPPGAVHSVVNNDTTATEQISMFIPQSKHNTANQFFKTYLVEDI
jgi:mannose-6-phosphate isomerase-like protein (cupin superfamily)